MWKLFVAAAKSSYKSFSYYICVVKQLCLCSFKSIELPLFHIFNKKYAKNKIFSK